MATSVLMMIVVIKSMMKAQVSGKWTTKFEKLEDFHHLFNTNITSIYMFISVTYSLH